MRLAVGTVLVLAGVLAMGALTRFRYTAEPERAELRLAWRTPVPRVVECRVPTPEEQAELPVHMRKGEICEGRAVRYRLEVAVDGEVLRSSVEGAAGMRSDRPLHVFEEIPLAPGRRRIRIVFERADTAGASSGDTAVPARLEFDRELRVGVHDVVLVTYDADRRRLVLGERSEG